MRKGFSTLIVVFFGIAAGIGFSMKPWHVYAAQKTATSRQVNEMRRVELQHIEDLRKEARLSSSVGREELARSQGFHRIGEVPADK